MEDMQGCSRWKGLVAQDSFCTLPRLCFSDPQGTVEQNLWAEEEQSLFRVQLQGDRRNAACSIAQLVVHLDSLEKECLLP
jgi:hypothetical protein